MMHAIRLVPYDPTWPAAFEALRALAAERLGDLVLEIHHVGSTSIPRLDAKPKIDIDVVLKSASSIAEAAARLKRFDYECHEDPYQDGMWCLTKGHGSFGERLYLSGPSHPVHDGRVRFRNHLSSHPELAAAYGELKRRLVAEAGADWERYTAGKSSFVAEVLMHAPKVGS